jgi:hypothetical protein
MCVKIEAYLPGSSKVEHRALDAGIGVRIPAGQPVRIGKRSGGNAFVATCRQSREKEKMQKIFIDYVPV